MSRRSRLALAGLLLFGVGTGLVLLWRSPERPVPETARGSLYFVSDREGLDALYVRHLPRGEARRLAITSEPVHDPALAPDGSRLAFTMGGRLGMLALPGGELTFLTLGVDYHDAQPSWRADGRALVVSARPRDAESADLFILDLETPGRPPARSPLTRTKGLDESAPAFAPDGSFVVFVREDNIFRVSLLDGKTTRLTGGFRKFRAPRFRPDGRLLCLFDESKRFGIQVMDADGRNPETLSLGSSCYRTLSPSPDGHYLVASFAFDLAFHPRDAFLPRKTEQLHLLDDRGRLLAALEQSAHYASHSPEWGR